MSESAPLPSFRGSDAALGVPPPDAIVYASWGRRAAAFLLDTVILVVLAVLAAALTHHHTPFNAFKLHRVHGKEQVLPVGSKLDFFSGASEALEFLYAVVFLAIAWQATPGMRTLGVHAARAEDHGRVSLARSAGRAAIVLGIATLSVLSPILVLVSVVDFLWPLWDARRQTLHDKWAGTVVLTGRPG